MRKQVIITLMLMLLTTTLFGQANDAKTLLNQAFVNLNKVKFFHAKALLDMSKAQAAMDGTVGPGFADITLKGFDGKVARHLIDEKGAYISTDGKKWSKDPGSQFAYFMQSMLLEPISERVATYSSKSKFKLVKNEVIAGDNCALLESIPASADESVVRFWVGNDPTLGRIIRQGKIFVETKDISFWLTVTYDKYNVPMKYTPPKL